MEKLLLNKNRGWRGLSEAQWLNDDGSIIQSVIFSFSKEMWTDLMKGYFVIQDDENYIVLKFDAEKSELPKPCQQRSVIIKSVVLPITEKKIYPKNTWVERSETYLDYNAIYNFIHNTNNHTKSDWNCFGIRVTPMI